MAFKKIVIAVCVAVIFAGGAITVYQVSDTGQDAAAKTERTEINESIPQEYNLWQLVDKTQDGFTAGFTDNVTVYYNNSTLVKGTDYLWNSTDGAINFQNTGSTNDSETADITYTYYENTAETQELSGPIETLTESIGTLGFFAMALSLVIMLVALAGLIATKIGGAKLPNTNR